MKKYKIILILCVFAFSNCDCSDHDPGWLLEERLEDITPDIIDIDMGVDLQHDIIPDPDFIEEDISLDMNEDIIEDLPPEHDGGTVEIEPNIPLDQALNERTAMVVDSKGTIWLAYHTCVRADCATIGKEVNVNLTLAHRAIGKQWTYENVKRQRGTFGLELYQDIPMLAFLDPTDTSFKIAKRLGKNRFEFTKLDVQHPSASAGLDITPDGSRLFVTFANDQGDPVSTFVHSQDKWRKLESLDIGNASAALERGLQADGQGNLFLVHQEGNNGDWGIAQYSLLNQQWLGKSYLRKPGLRASSMVVDMNQEICIASQVNNSYLSVSCGDMNNLERNQWSFPNERLSSYSSLIRNPNGTLFIAYNAENNARLRLAQKTINGEWTFSTLFEKNSFGVSTAIDINGRLIVSYYTCDNGRCAIEITRRSE